MTSSELPPIDGLTVRRALLPADIVARITERVDALASRPPGPGGPDRYFQESELDGSRILIRVEAFLDHDPVLRELLLGAPVLDAVAQQLGGAPALFKDKINLKLPGAPADVLHHDFVGGWAAYAPHFVTLVLPLDRNQAGNAAMEFVVAPEWRQAVLDQPLRRVSIDEVPESAFQRFDAEPGDAVLFDAHLLHRSPANRGMEPRRNVLVTFNLAAAGDHRAVYYADLRRSSGAG